MLPQTTEKPFAAIFLENFRKTAKTVDSVGLALVAIWYDGCASRVQLPVKRTWLAIEVYILDRF